MESPRLQLRRILAVDRAELVSVINESFETLHRWMPWAAEPYTAEKAREFIDPCDDGWARLTQFNFAIMLIERLVGVCGARRTPAGGLDIGY